MDKKEFALWVKVLIWSSIAYVFIMVLIVFSILIH